jgi:predicted DNA-binding protein
LQEEQIDPWCGIHQAQEFTSGLLRACKTVHSEASPVFYGQNRFNFSDSTPEQVGSFLEHIGKTNASYIRDIMVDFPDVLCLDSDEVSLEEDTRRIFETVRGACANLNTISTSLYSTDLMEHKLDSLDNFKVATEALALVDIHFRSIPSVQEIIVEVYEDPPSDHIRKTMESHGWAIRTTVYEEDEDWGRDFSDFDDDDDDYEYDSTGDDYDIDNDSDFWRRAAD